MADSPHYDLQGEMQVLAQAAVIAVFSKLMRIHLATQHGAQRQMTIAILQHEFTEALRTHESQVLVDSVLTDRGKLFRTSYMDLSAALLLDIGRGLTDEERKAILG